MADNFMASNIPASQLIIGSWQRISNNTDDLTAKFFYTTKNLWWEVSDDGGLKRKIEMRWDDISAISAHTLDNGVGKLEIQLNQPPSFAQKSNHQRRRRYSFWKKAQDFTQGQASICRRHTVYFPPGKLEQEFKTLIECDRRLLDLSNKPFPSDDYPYFHQDLSQFLELPLLPTEYLPELPHSQHNYPVQNIPPPPILPPHSNNLTQRTGPHSNIMNPLSPLSDMDPLFIDEGGRRSYAYENQWGNQGVNNGGSNYAYENQLGNNGVNNHNQGLDSIPLQGNDFQNYNLNYEGESSGMNNPNTMHWLPPHDVPYEGMSVNSTMNTSANQYDPPHDQVFKGSMNANSSINSHIQRLDYVTMATAQGNSYQNYNLNGEELPRLNKQRLNNLARVASKYQAEYSSTIQDHPLPIQSMPPHQDSNEGMTVNSSVNTSMCQYPPQCQISNVGMSVNSAGRTPLSQYAPTHQVSGMSINSAMPTPMYQYVPPHQAFSRGMSVNSAISTPMHQSAAPSHVSNNDTDITSSIQSSAYQYTLPDQWGNQGVNNGGSNYAYENIPWGDNGINNHNQGLDSILGGTLQGNEIQNYNLNHGDESSRMNTGINVNSAINTSMYQYEQHHDQVYNGSMNVNSSMNAFTNPYLSPDPTMEDFEAMAARQNTHQWN